MLILENTEKRVGTYFNFILSVMWARVSRWIRDTVREWQASKCSRVL